jgi:hypothetical protein
METDAEVGTQTDPRDAYIAALRKTLEVFALPRATQRQGNGATRSELDTVLVEVDMADVWRAGALLGTLGAEYLRGLASLNPELVPSEAFLAELHDLEQLHDAARP